MMKELILWMVLIIGFLINCYGLLDVTSNPVKGFIFFAIGGAVIVFAFNGLINEISKKCRDGDCNENISSL